MENAFFLCRNLLNVCFQRNVGCTPYRSNVILLHLYNVSEESNKAVGNQIVAIALVTLAEAASKQLFVISR